MIVPVELDAEVLEHHWDTFVRTAQPTSSEPEQIWHDTMHSLREGMSESVGTGPRGIRMLRLTEHGFVAFATDQPEIGDPTIVG